MPRHISKKDLFDYILKIRNSGLGSHERFDMFINYLNHLRDYFFTSVHQLPSEYYTIDYWDIQEIIMDGRVLTYFISMRDKDITEFDKKYFMFLTCDADPNNRTNSNKRCGFDWDLVQSWKAWEANMRTLRAGKIKKQSKKHKKRNTKRRR